MRAALLVLALALAGCTTPVDVASTRCIPCEQCDHWNPWNGCSGQKVEQGFTYWSNGMRVSQCVSQPG